MIPLIKYSFTHESEMKKKLADFILRTDIFSMSEQCQLFESEFAKYHNSKHAVLFNSGGSANLAMLQTLLNLNLIKKNSRVGFSAITWSTNVMPIIQLGLIPVPLELDINTLNISMSNLEGNLRDQKIDVLFITNALGFAAELDKVDDICKNNNIILLEDNCESLGSRIGNKLTGTFGLMGSCSFYVAHHMSTIEGGMVLTDDDEIREMLTLVRANGWTRNASAEYKKSKRELHSISSSFDEKYTFYDLGYNLRPTEITGFLGNQQLKYLDELVLKREENYKYVANFCSENDEIITFKVPYLSTISSFALPFIFKNKKMCEKYKKRFLTAEIEIRPIISGNMVNQPFFKKYVDTSYNFPVSDHISECGFYCGNYPELSKSELDQILGCLTP